MTYTAGIVGTGGVAGMGLLGTHEDVGEQKSRASHAGGFEAVDGIDLVAAADVDDEKLERFGEAWDVPEDHRYDSHSAMLDDQDLDVVSVTTPTFLHADHVVDAVRSPAAPDVVWCEKPIASSISDARRAVDACHETDTELVVNHTFRFTEKIRELRGLLQGDNLLGDVRAVNSQFRMELMRNSTHLIDTLVYLLDVEPRWATGWITGENEAMEALGAGETTDVDDAGGGGMLVTDDGAFVTIDCTVPREISSMRYEMVGTEGKLYLNNDDGEWRYWRLEDGDHVEESLPGIEGAWTWADDYRRGFANAVGHLVDLLDGTAENRSSGEDAIRSLEVIVAFYVSNATGGRVSFPLDRPIEDVRIKSW
ncbi:Gfo/Idh/MocA family protein [Halobacteriales archaeon Cl-PHB]